MHVFVLIMAIWILIACVKGVARSDRFCDGSAWDGRRLRSFARASPAIAMPEQCCPRPGCQAANPANAQFCRRCGESFASRSHQALQPHGRRSP